MLVTFRLHLRFTEVQTQPKHGWHHVYFYFQGLSISSQNTVLSHRLDVTDGVKIYLSRLRKKPNISKHISNFRALCKFIKCPLIAVRSGRVKWAKWSIDHAVI